MPKHTSVVFTIAAGTLVAVTLSYYIYRRKCLQKPPKNGKWQYVGTVQEVAVYPISSGAVLLLKDAYCNTDGLYTQDFKDRSLILYKNEDDKAAFAGIYPHMLSITTEILDKNNLVVRAPQRQALIINLLEIQRKTSKIKRKDGLILHLIEGAPEHHEWFSKVILNKKQGLKLFYNFKIEFEHNFLGEDKSDFNPVMLMTNKSVIDLNQRLTKENLAHHLQFRGNLLIDCAENIEAYAEDNWKWLKIGNNADSNCILRYCAPCLRCILPNVNIETCKRNPNFEPLKTLKGYRLIHNAKEPTLGAYFKVFQTGNIKLNDPVYAIIS